MTDQNALPLIFRMRCVSGEFAGSWLWMMLVTQRGIPFQVTNWDGVLSRPEQYEFHPKFVETESAAFRPISMDVAQAFARVLKRIGIDVEIVATQASPAPSSD